ncbi:hypothetical protein SUGI_1185200 [Cryptomeria japonica]|nr:hypothetical protein SUGI_1185200 [Cryptomeria japonica]
MIDAFVGYYGSRLLNYGLVAYFYQGDRLRVVDELSEKKKLMEDSDNHHGCNCYKAAEEEKTDPIYGNDKRLVPTGPDPLHNRLTSWVTCGSAFTVKMRCLTFCFFSHSTEDNLIIPLFG